MTATAHALTPPEWPKIDLPGHNLVRLSLLWCVLDENRLNAAFAELLVDDEAFLAVVPYRRSKLEHRRLQLVGRMAGDEHCHVWLQFDASGEWPSGAVPKALQRSSEFMARLQRIGPLGPAQCRAEFYYREGDDYSTVFPLPFELDTTGEISWPIDEIRGIRGVKREPQNPERSAYTFTLDRRADAGIWLLLTFEVPPGPVEDAPDDALNTATAIAKEFVFKHGS